MNDLNASVREEWLRVLDRLDTPQLVHLIDDYQAWLRVACKTDERLAREQLASRIDDLVEYVGIREAGISPAPF